MLTDATADLAFTLLLAAARRLPEARGSVTAGDWLTWEPGATSATTSTARRSGSSDGTDRPRGRPPRGGLRHERAAHRPRRRRCRSPQLLARSDFVSIHCPLTPDTHHLIDAAALAGCARRAILINTARGPIVDQGALIEALATGGSPARRSTSPTPSRSPAGDPLLSAPNLIVAPHIGSATRTARERMATLAVENLLAALDGEPMPHPVARPAEPDADRVPSP